MIYAPPYDFYSTKFINYYNKTYFYQFVNLVFKQMWELNRLFKWISWFFKISTFYWSKLILSIIAFSNFFFLGISWHNYISQIIYQPNNFHNYCCHALNLYQFFLYLSGFSITPWGRTWFKSLLLAIALK